jgi:hypothetical protein
MRRQSVITQKKRGPPATGKGELIGVRIQPALMQALDGWIADRGLGFTRPEAIRRLVEHALGDSASVRPASGKQQTKAAGLAGRTVDQLGDQTATGEERAQRKRRLIKGPREFREMRADQPKKEG